MTDSTSQNTPNVNSRAAPLSHPGGTIPATRFEHSLAVVIGIDAYGHGIPRLTTAVNDATRLAKLLQDAHGYETILLTEPTIGQPVTLERLRTLFSQDLKARLGEDDRLLVYFAGHGVALDGDDGPRGYLVPQDARPGDSASMLAMTDLNGWLTALPCRHMLAILDCCFAGAFRWSVTRNIGGLPDVIHKERYDRYLLSPAWQVLTSAAYDQKALDVLAGDAKRGARAGDHGSHSPFALALFDALEKGDADLVPKNGGDGVITATELYLYLREQVEVQADVRANHEQTPGLWPLNKHRKGEFIFLAPGHLLNLPPAPDLTGEANPYRGLKSYDQKHSPLFFGRDQEIEELAALVDQQPFVAVLGASGTGKSSLVKAGVLPRLPYSVLPPMRPTDHPLRALEALLRSALGEDVIGPVGGDDGLAQIIARWAVAHPDQRLVLTIDQFEELVTLCRDDAERDRFLRLLAKAIEKQPEAFRLIITLRTDFEPQFTQKDSPLAGLWEAGRYIVPPMDIEDLRQAIEGPASVRVLYFDPPELVDALIKEVIQTPGALPLLSFTLSELYVKYVRSGRDDRALSGADYQALGGVVGSLRNRATEEYDNLPNDVYRATMQRVMLRMVAVEGGELARRRVALSELAYPTEEENAHVQVVLDRLVDARLLVRGTNANADGESGEAYVEPVHDALVLAWDKLMAWKREAEEYLPLQRRLALAATEWNRAQPEARSGLLWDDDPRLPQVEETLWPADGKQKGLRGRVRWAKQVLAPNIDTPADTKWVNGMELAFVQTSVRTRIAFWRRTVAITATIMIALAALTVFALIQRGAAIAEARRSKSGELTALAENVLDINPDLALILARMAVNSTYEVDRTTEPRAAAVLYRSLMSPIDHVFFDTEMVQMIGVYQDALINRDGSRLVPFAAEASLWNTNGYYIRKLGGIAKQFSPDGRRLVTVNDGICGRPDLKQAKIDVWDADGKLLASMPGPLDHINHVSFSDDGESLLAVIGCDEQRLLIWDVDNDAIKDLGPVKGNTTWASFRPEDNQWVATLADGKLQLWDTASGATEVLTEGEETITSVLFAPNGKHIVTVSEHGRAHLWGVNGESIAYLSGLLAGGWAEDVDPALSSDGFIVENLTEVTRLAFSPGSDAIATVLNSGQVQIWNTDGELESELEPLEASVYEIRFSHDGSKIISTDSDGRVGVWDRTGSLITSQEGSIAGLSADGSQFLALQNLKLLRVWSLAGQKIAEFSPHADTTTAMQYSPDGRIITSGCDSTNNFIGCQNGSTRIWNVENVELGERILGPSTPGTLELNPDGNKVLISRGDESGAVFVWDIDNQDFMDLDTVDAEAVITQHSDLHKTQEPQTLLDQTSAGTVLSPSGMLVATVDISGTVRISEVSSASLLFETPSIDSTLAKKECRLATPVCADRRG